MGLTSALNTSLNGLVLNETMIDVLGNNIANAGTNGFKSSQAQFTTQLSRTLSVGSRPTATNGGTNPRQIGLGATTAAIVRDFSQGSITNSSSPSDLAIEGDGFFVMQNSDGISYTRNGSFSRNSNSILTNASGLKVQGYAVDDNFNLITTQLSDLSIPLGDLNVAQQTENAIMNGALLPTGILGTLGSVLNSAAMYSDGVGTPAVGGTLLTSLSSSSTSVVPLFTAGETLTFTARKGGVETSELTLDVTGATVADLLTMYDNSIGIDSTSIPPGSGQTPGVTIDGAGQIIIQGNAGTVNNIEVSIGDLTSNGSSVALVFSSTQTAIGESTVTDFAVFDSLGQEVKVRMSAVMESKTPSTTTFRYFLESEDDSDADSFIDTGTITFDSEGKVISGGLKTFAVDRDNSAAVSPMQITMDLSQISGISSESAGSTLSIQSQDGSSPGTLTSFVIDDVGVINGVFNNGEIRTLGQITLARFANTQGLVENGNGTFVEGVSSGTPFVATAGNFGAGALRAGAIELSNTDIGKNLVDLVVASTNYRGNARVISSVQQLIDELLILGR
jgi:flagellar hook protein FlgE